MDSVSDLVYLFLLTVDTAESEFIIAASMQRMICYTPMSGICNTIICFI